MTTVRMCDHCKQLIKDKQVAHLSLTIETIDAIPYYMDCHMDCLPDWMRSFHEEQTAKYKPKQPSQYYPPPNTISF